MKKRAAFAGVIILMAVMTLFSETVFTGAKEGVNLCLGVIIPSLFPFLFLTNVLTRGGYIQTFGGKKTLYITLLVSILGGYPVGAGIITELYGKGAVDKEGADTMLNFCFNAGPGFIFLVVGDGVFGSKIAGAVLFAAHIIPSVVISLHFKNRITVNSKSEVNKVSFNFSDIIVNSVAKASAAALNICGFIVIFSVINELVNAFLSKLFIAKYLTLFLEISNAVRNTNNIYLISFLLSFGGICVWMQVLSLSNNRKINLARFALFRVIHGGTSAFLTYIIIRVFKVPVNTSTPVANTDHLCSFNRVFLSVSMLIMLVVLFAAAERKNNCGNIRTNNV